MFIDILFPIPWCGERSSQDGGSKLPKKQSFPYIFSGFDCRAKMTYCTLVIP